MMDRSHLYQKHMNMEIVCKNMFTKGVQMATICTNTCLETLSSLVSCIVNNVLSEIGPYHIKRFFSSLRTVNKQKPKC